MNFTQEQTLENFLEHVSRIKKKSLYRRAASLINAEIDKVCIRCAEGLWGLTNSDQEYLEALRTLHDWCISEKHNGKELANIRNRYCRRTLLKVVFFTQEFSVWPSLMPLYEECAKRADITAQIVHIPFLNPDKSTDSGQEMMSYQEHGYEIISSETYDLAKESPDIAFFVKPYDLIPKPFELRPVIKTGCRCVYVPYFFYAASGELFTSYACSLPMHTAAWYVVADSKKYAEDLAAFGYRGGRNVLKLGHPRTDIHRRGMLPPIPEAWDKLAGRKIVLYNTHFSVEHGSGMGTFRQYGKTVFAWFRAHRDVGLIWRPHPLMPRHMVDTGVCTQEEWDQMIRSLSQEENIVVDLSSDYLPSFFYSNALISDGTSFLKEYLLTEKPICYTRKSDTFDHFSSEKLPEAYSIADDPSDIECFLENVQQGKDIRRERRIAIMRDEFYGVDTPIAPQIIDYLYRQLLSEVRGK